MSQALACAPAAHRTNGQDQQHYKAKSAPAGEYISLHDPSHLPLQAAS